MDTSGEGGIMYSKGSNLKDWAFLVPQESMNTWAVILDDPNPIHLDANAAKQVGLGDKTINQGPANIAYILNMIEENFPNSRILKMNNKMTDSVLEGDLVTVSGQISEIKAEGDQFIASCSIQLTVGEDKIAVLSEIDVLFERSQ
jgi:acyl dehydratase